ncbi:MAG: IclR family transcriptional regulator [Tropicimonas sp.]|uniref:IclR family transcriptional regulator n=1 Tax=Tropicimonas sp. TaxID=2067044 RepID=UPI003A88CB6C
MRGTSPDRSPTVSGTQTLMRGLELLECIGRGTSTVKAMTQELGLPRSTLTRMLSGLVAAGYLYHIPYKGYFLGPRLVELGERGAEQRPLVSIARPVLEALSASVRDTVYLGLFSQEAVLYIDKLPSSRGIDMQSQIGYRMPLASTALGKAMMMCLPEADWPDLYAISSVSTDERNPFDRDRFPPMRDFADLARDLREAKARGWSYDLEESEYGIRCVAAPVTDRGGRPVGAVSVSGALSFMPDERMEQLGAEVRAAAERISRALRWQEGGG